MSETEAFSTFSFLLWMMMKRCDETNRACDESNRKLDEAS